MVRADAARNRATVLAAASKLICEDGLDQVSMDDIAAAAGVGKGTLFRRFTDKEGLIRAVFDDRTAQAWERVHKQAGDSTIAPRERALAFVEELFDLTVVQLQPLMRAMSNECRPEIWAPWRELLTALISEIRPDADAEFLTLMVFSGMRSEIAMSLPRERHRDSLLALTADLLRAS